MMGRASCFDIMDYQPICWRHCTRAVARGEGFRERRRIREMTRAGAGSAKDRMTMPSGRARVVAL